MKQILIIDDDSRNTFALKAVLKAKKFNSICASSAAEGISYLKSQDNIGIILMDIMMPDMDGYEAISLILGNKKTKHIPVVAVTAKAMSGDKEKCLNAGALGYISKPIDIDTLLVVLRNVLK